MSANERQVDGDHYKKPIQVWDFVHQNNIGYLAGNVIKYVARYKDKHGMTDLMKARHYLDKLVEEESKIGTIDPSIIDPDCGPGSSYVNQD